MRAEARILEMSKREAELADVKRIDILTKPMLSGFFPTGATG
jgi:hypothetical protein